MTAHATHGYSVWLEPEGSSGRALKALIDRFSSEATSPAFEPHVTLIGGIEAPLNEIRKRTKSISAAMDRFLISFKRIRIEDYHHRSIILECEHVPELMDINQMAQKSFGRSYVYDPHASLLYSDLPAVAKERLISIIKPPIFELGFEVSALSIWHTEGMTEHWRKVDEF